ncbi:MAG: replicative DNA helicase [Brevundimonas sp.]|uniref:replicative DNA helicase n=1 Tax=Brevundimonas sp. TaxID=1871086 RepID=UPI00391CC947
MSTIEFEQGLIGAVLLENSALGELNEPIPREAFSEPAYRELWPVVTALIQAGRLADPLPVLEKAPWLDQAFADVGGGLRHLADLIDKAPPTRSVPAYGDALMRGLRRRVLRELGGEMIAQADQNADPFDIASKAESRIAEMVRAAAPDGASMISARESVDATITRLIDDQAAGRTRGHMTGLRCFDHRMGGLVPGRMLVLAGRPSMGKTALMRAAANGCARRHPDHSVIIFSMEMTDEELAKRTLAELAYEAGDAMQYQDFDRPDQRLTRDQAESLNRFRGSAPANLVFDATPHVSADYIRRRTLSACRSRPVAAVFIDYLQIMDRRIDGRWQSEQNAAAVLGHITSSLKRLAKEAGVCVVLLSQLSRQVEQRESKRPLLSDLRESGSIEQDADAVSFVYRESYYLERQGPAKGISETEHELAIESVRNVMEVICAKQRAGSIGTDRQRYLAGFDVIDNEVAA